MIVIFTTVAVYLIGIHVKMNQSLKHQVTKDMKDLLILGSCLKDQELSPTLRARLEMGANLLKQNPNLKVIVTGGKGTDTLIEEYGIGEERILVEDQSSNTFENLLFSKRLLTGEKVAIVTNEFHSVRTSLLARRLGIPHVVIGVKTPSKKRYKWECREHLALVKSWLVDRKK